jgi:hypothetical protein
MPHKFNDKLACLSESIFRVTKQLFRQWRDPQKTVGMISTSSTDFLNSGTIQQKPVEQHGRNAMKAIEQK